MFIASLAASLGAQSKPVAAPASYESPYEMVFAAKRADLTADFARAPWKDAGDSGDVPFAEWYADASRKKLGTWGPRPRQFPAPDGIEGRSLLWRRERVLAAAERLIGYGYQHHHLPEWAPPADWPWKATCAGANGKGVDCSNFTAWAYDFGLGVRLVSDVEKQEKMTKASGPGGKGEVGVERIERGESFAAFTARLEPADLVFVKNREGNVSHVVMWLGSCGRFKAGNLDPGAAPSGRRTGSPGDPDPGATPSGRRTGSPGEGKAGAAPALVIDSHGDTAKDTLGGMIPCGVRIRPFTDDSWYWRSASHALRVLHEPAPAPK